MRIDGREVDQLRPFTIEPGFIGSALGSALVTAGRTRVICTASQEARPPSWLKEGGWVTAEYAMLPGSVRPRGRRESGGREKEIQRLIGRSLRAAIDLGRLVGPGGPISLVVDCDVIEADGGTRTAAITGAYVALVDAVRWLQAKKDITKNPVIGAVAAVSVGVWRGIPVLDLDYAEDSDCDTDMNVVMNDGGGFIEVQGTAEGHAFRRDELDALLVLSEKGIRELLAAQQAALAQP